MKRFDIITETDARVLARGETVMLAPRGHITPLAQDTLRERRITVVREGRTVADEAALAPRGGHPHASRSPATIRASALRQRLVTYLRGRGLAVDDLGRTAPSRWTTRIWRRSWRAPWPEGRRTPGSSSTARASARQSPPTR